MAAYDSTTRGKGLGGGKGQAVRGDGRDTPGARTREGLKDGEDRRRSLDMTTHGGKVAADGNGLRSRPDMLDTPGARTTRTWVNDELIDKTHLVHQDSVHHNSRPRTGAYDIGGRPGKPLNMEQTRGSKNQKVK